MNPKSKNPSFQFLFVLVAFFLGIFIGLVVLGWWLWPVQWTGGSFNALNSVDQKDFLRAAIDSYSYDPDNAIAQQRYAALGDQKARILSDILANPGNLKKAEVEKFANTIKAPQVLLTPTEAIATSAPVPALEKSAVSSLLSIVGNLPSWLNICLPVGILIVVVFVISMVFLSRRKKKSKKSAGQSIEPMKPEDAGIFAEISGQGKSNEIHPDDAITYDNAEVSTAMPEEIGLPDWLREVSTENRQVPAETSGEEPAIELSDSDIKDITSSKFSTLESKPATSLDSGEINQVLISSGAFVPDNSDKSVEPFTRSIQSESRPIPIEKVPPFQETQEETLSKFSREIELTPGIDPENAKKLRSLGITAPLLLLRKGASPQGRQSIAAGLGIPEMQVLRWVNSIDLLRIKGLTIEDALMLKAAGVDILVELATRDPESLLEKLVASSKMTTPSYRLPTLAQVQNWITQARELPRIISYS